MEKKEEMLMPVVQISLLPGRTAEMKERLMQKVTDAVTEALGVPKESVHILLYEIPKENIAHGGIPLSQSKP